MFQQKRHLAWRGVADDDQVSGGILLRHQLQAGQQLRQLEQRAIPVGDLRMPHSIWFLKGSTQQISCGS